ncbi:MAG TPA: hypothetical protein VLS90_09560 [Thermodesulfobacteriota bacterium]|nr:hypothetical protein [Thermodesulfobacteriota bacterium]
MAARNVDAPPAPTWDLRDLYESPEDPAWEKDLLASVERAGRFQAERRGLGGRDPSSRSAAEFTAALTEYESIQEQGLKPFLYASLLFSEDTQNSRFQGLLQKAKEQWNELENRLLFFRLAIIALPDETLKSFLAHEPLRPYEHAISFLRRFRPYTRAEKEEEILSRKNLTGRSAFVNLFDEYTGSFTFRLEVEGEEREFTGPQMLSFL